jgi:hypothetical protein
MTTVRGEDGMILWKEDDLGRWWPEDQDAWVTNMKQLRSIAKETEADVRKHEAYFKKKNEQECSPKYEDAGSKVVAHVAQHYRATTDKLIEVHENIKKEMNKMHNTRPPSHLAQWKKESDEFDAIINIVRKLGTASWYTNFPNDVVLVVGPNRRS